MALFDGIVAGIARQFGLGDKARSLIGWLLSMMTDSKTGGLGGFLDKMRHAGLGSLVSGMMGGGEKAPLTSNQVESLFGRNALGAIASKLGIGETLATSAVATALPNLIGAVTPNGVVPDRLPAEAEGFMREATSALGAAGRLAADTGRQAVGAAQAAAGTANAWLWGLLPLLALGLLAVFLIRSCSSPVATSPTTASRVTTTHSTPPTNGSRVTAPDVTKLTADLTGNFNSLTDTLGDIKDVASATTAMPKLTELGGKLGGMKALVDKLPDSAKAKITDLIKDEFGKLGGQLTQLLWIPGVGAKIKPALDVVLGKMADLGGLPIPHGPQVTSDLASVFSSLTETLSGIRDSAAAEKAVPKLMEISGKIDDMKDAVAKLSDSEKSTLRPLIQSAINKLKELTVTLFANGGISAKIKPVVTTVLDKLTTLAG
jgi:uncharacterized protein YidB (DUF937 family)